MFEYVVTVLVMEPRRLGYERLALSLALLAVTFVVGQVCRVWLWTNWSNFLSVVVPRQFPAGRGSL